MKFLNSFPNTVFQTFKDNPQAGGYAKVFDCYDEAEFKKLNKLGCGIYFTPNGFKGGRKLDLLSNINAVYADLDVAKEGKQGDKQPIIKALLTDKLVPNFIIETKNGVQPIWLIENTTDGELCVKVMKGIIEWSKQYGCKGDNVYDLTRVLRLPNYYHMKGEAYMCSAKKFSDEVYPIELMAEAFPYEEKKKAIKSFQVNHKKGDVTMAIECLDFKELVIRAFAYVGRPAGFDNQDRLILDGRLTGTFLGENGNFLASTSHEPFVGNRITVVADILQVTNKEAFVWIREEYGLKAQAAKTKALEMVNEVVNTKQKERKSHYTWGTKALTENFAPIKSDTYVIVGAGYGTGKTTFCVDMAIKNAKLGHKVLYLSLEMSTEEIYDKQGRDAAGIGIPEEIYKRIPEGKQRTYEAERRKLEGLKNFTLKGFKGGTDITWDCLVELMKGDWDLIFVDNFNLIAKEPGLNQYEHEGKLSSRFVNYITRNQTPVVVVHHYSKGGAREDVKTGYSLSGNAKIMNDAHRIVLLKRKNLKKIDSPTDEDKAMLYVVLDKGRGYEMGVSKLVFFHKGSFYDEYQLKQPRHTEEWWDK